ncbi:exopolysaccharide biosynthesis polyprenyl glycosylphosphotransferase [Dietzia kunjamensis]|uniref:exopolysaccharide biosynthesis polyprenyl glycosylphosphotransferase n=1 Tax=Dietzia kunjamensis TaxID=322509 RepID=UPI0020983163|nr:exopolysaccharide biosynthesis polyprenyl glycosylphosphotransferase [Dietzia kunjamensis]USX45178.1 exopolysaccharide biosynthesis polyprenyl glycosylphosphotransferase [Dietzia kunjamensis]
MTVRDIALEEQGRARRVSRRRSGRLLAGLDVAIQAVVISAFVDSFAGAVAGAILVVLAVELSGNYRALITVSALNDAPRLAAASVVGALVVEFARGGHDSIRDLLVMIAAVFAALFLTRAIFYALVRRRRRRNPGARRRTVIVGGGKVAAELLDSIREFPELGLEPVAVIDSDPLLGADRLPVPVLDRPLHDAVVELDVETVIVAFQHRPDSSLISPLRQCDRLDCEIFLVPRMFEFVHLNSDMDRIHTVPLIRVRRHIHRTWYWQAKRVFDVVVAGSALVLLSPLLALTAAAVALSDRGAPVLFRQVRVGRGGHEFVLYKFRSMRPVDAGASDTDWHPEDRIGPVGRILRASSIDELPQLWNVVRGDMSLVGPRPERPHFVEQFARSVPSYVDRHRATVGLTGWSAVHGLRGDTSIDDRALYDNFYIQNWSVWLDIKILLLTVKAVLAGTGS